MPSTVTQICPETTGSKSHHNTKYCAHLPNCMEWHPVRPLC